MDNKGVNSVKLWALVLSALGVATALPFFVVLMDGPSSSPSEDPATATATSSGPKAVKAVRTINVTPELAATGKASYAMCSGCHGAEGEGRVGIGPKLAAESFLAAASDEFLVSTILEGRAGTTMIPWKSSLDRAGAEAIVAYLRTLAPSEPTVLDESALTASAEEGQAIFKSVCASCHGKSGGGYQESANGTGIGRTAFLASASNGFLRSLIQTGKTHTPMRGFAGDDPAAVANLTSAEVDGIIAYLRANAW